MAVATLVSRITGLLRTMVLAAALGVGLVNDAYNTANTLPNIVYELLLGGVLTSVVVPLLVHAQERDRDGGTAYAQRLATIAIAGLAVVTALAILAAPLLTSLVRDHREPRPGAAGHLAGPDPAGGDRLLRHRRAGPGDPELPRRLRAARRGRRCSTTSSSSPPAGCSSPPAGPGELTPVTITPGQVWLLGIGTTLGIAVQALVLLPLLRRRRRARCGRAGGCATPGCARPARSASG